MKVHFSAWLALVSVATYSACGSTDPAQSVQEGGAGAGGDAGAGADAGGSQNAAGSVSEGGTSGGSEGGAAGTPVVTAGAAGSEEPVGGAAGAGGAGDAAGAGGAPDSGLPAGCPGVIGDYTQLEGDADPNTFDATALQNKKLVFGLDGADVFEKDLGGGDCLVGGAGDDELSNPGESASYLIGGEGADLFHLDQVANNYARIVDMSAEDQIGLSKAAYPFLAGSVGSSPYDSQLHAVADYEAGTGMVPSNEGAAIVYDPGTGGLWIDTDRGTKGGTETQIGTIVNHAGYEYSAEDFVLED